ncbi:MAG: hypothetical protein HZB37_01400 [Planctomycetes bacterium]|nr:hypothetical protein [Planctomycetota bacterium]
MKKLKSAYIALGFVVMHAPCLMGGSENISNNKQAGVSATLDKLQAKANLSNDIERPLLRPIQVKIEEKPVAYEPEEQEMEVPVPEVVVTSPSQQQSKPEPEPQSQPSSLPGIQAQDERGEGAILLTLKVEKEKLQALERKYGQLEDELKPNGGKDLSAQATATALNNRHTPARDTSSAKNTPFSKTEEKPVKSVGTNAGDPAIGQQKEHNNNFKVLSEDALNSRLEKEMKTANSFNVAECYYKLCEYENALKGYKMLTPDNCPVEQYHWAQFQIANCYRNLKDLETALGEFKRFIGLSHDNELIDQANWYISDIQWWKTWNEKKSLLNNQLLAASGNKESK